MNSIWSWFVFAVKQKVSHILFKAIVNAAFIVNDQELHCNLGYIINLSLQGHETVSVSSAAAVTLIPSNLYLFLI